MENLSLDQVDSQISFITSRSCEYNQRIYNARMENKQYLRKIQKRKLLEALQQQLMELKPHTIANFYHKKYFKLLKAFPQLKSKIQKSLVSKVNNLHQQVFKYRWRQVVDQIKEMFPSYSCKEQEKQAIFWDPLQNESDRDKKHIIKLGDYKIFWSSSVKFSMQNDSKDNSMTLFDKTQHNEERKFKWNCKFVNFPLFYRRGNFEGELQRAVEELDDYLVCE